MNSELESDVCYRVYGWRHLVNATEVSGGLAESNGSLPPGGWLSHLWSDCPCTPGSAPGPTLGNEYHFLARDISRLCHDASPSVRLSVTEVHLRIIANLGVKFRSHFTAHCGRRASGGRRAACVRIISRHMLASARLSYYYAV